MIAAGARDAYYYGGIVEILDRLDGVRRTRRGWSARCPAHRDHSPSLSVAEGIGGRVLLHCHAGCSYDEITRVLGLERMPAPKDTGRGWESPLAAARGEVLAEARRQPWAREEVALTYVVADAIRWRRRAVDVARRAATAAGDRLESWALLARAATVELEAETIEAQLEEALA